MMIRFVLIGVLISSVVPADVLAAGPSVALCRARMTDDLTVEHDTFRAHMFGTVPLASSSSSSSNSSSSSSSSSSAMHVVRGGGSVSRAYTGILERKGRLTSELIGPLVESYRVYRCRSYRVCAVLEASIPRSDQSDRSEVELSALGCDTQKTVKAPPYPECYFAGTNPGIQQTLSDGLALVSECNRLVEASLTMERNALKTAVAYHGGYVSGLQFAGIVQHMVNAIRVSTLLPIRQMMTALGALHQIPCFIAQCDVNK